MKRFTLLPLMLPLILLLAGCGSDSSPQNLVDPTVPPVERKLEVDADQIRERQGCLNLTRLFDGIRNTPEGTVVREVTQDFKLDQVRQAYPRHLFLRGLALKSFLFNETSPQEYLATRPRFEQIGCEKIIAHSALGAPIEARIETWDETSVQIAFDSRRETYRLHGATELEIIRQGRALDDCNRREMIFPIQVTSIIRWNTSDVLAERDENIGFKFLGTFSEALNELPVELGEILRRPFTDERGLEVVTLNPEMLKKLASTEETVQTKRCSELPVATPTPVPTPRPASPKPRSIIDIFFDWFRS